MNYDGLVKCYLKSNEPEKPLNVLLEVQNVISGGCKWMMASNLKKMAKCLQRLAKYDEALQRYDEYIRMECNLHKDTRYCFKHDKDFYELKCMSLFEKVDLQQATICFSGFS